MDRQQANEESRKSPPGSHSLRCIWYCGRINEQVRRAARLGEKKLEMRFPPKHYVAIHREVFREIYLNQGYDVGFAPNFQYIQPTEWIFTLGWDDEDQQAVQA